MHNINNQTDLETMMRSILMPNKYQQSETAKLEQEIVKLNEENRILREVIKRMGEGL